MVLRFRPQGNVALECVHSTIHNILAMYVISKQASWTELLPLVQLAHSTANNKTLVETTHIFMFGRRATLHIDVVLGALPNAACHTQLEFLRQTVANMQLGYDISRRNFTERADKQAVPNEKWPVPEYFPGEQVLVHGLYTLVDCPNHKLIILWRGPCTARSKLSPVVYRASCDGEITETSAHWARIQLFNIRKSIINPSLSELGGFFLGAILAVSDLDATVLTVPIYVSTIEVITAHTRGTVKKNAPFGAVAPYQGIRTYRTKFWPMIPCDKFVRGSWTVPHRVKKEGPTTYTVFLARSTFSLFAKWELFELQSSRPALVAIRALLLRFSPEHKFRAGSIPAFILLG